MRELERNAADTPSSDSAWTGPSRIGVVGAGRLGRALAGALERAGYVVDGPAGRGDVPAGDAIVLCVPDAEITGAARAVAGAASLVGHTSGATALSALNPAADAGAELFGLHPLQTFTTRDGPDRFVGAGCAVAGSTVAATESAAAIARRLGMTPFELADDDRPAYHAAASIASNFLVTLEAAAESVAAAAGIEATDARRMLAPLVRATVENWAAAGPRGALTGPVARGDEETVAAQRSAVERAQPDLLPLFDALVERTRRLAAERSALAGVAA